MNIQDVIKRVLEISRPVDESCLPPKQENDIRRILTELYESGLEMGKESGYEFGKECGYEEGYSKGYELGYTAGFAQGYEGHV